MTHPVDRPRGAQPRAVLRPLPVRFTPSAAPPRVRHDPGTDLPVSCLRILDALRDGPASQGGLQEATGMPARTLRYALGRLRHEGRVVRVPSLQDTRLVYYALHPGCLPPERRRALGRSMTRMVLSGPPAAQ